MPLVVKDRVKETTTTTGTGTLTLAGAVTGFQAFSVIGNGNTTYYTITDGTNFEVGVGTYTLSGTALSRDTILESSNSGSAVNWSAGSKDVFVTYPAERAVYTDGAGTAITPATASTLGVASGGTGAATLTANNVILGNGTSAVQFVAPGTTGNVLTSNGTTWASTAPAAPSGVLAWQSVQTSNFNADAGKAYPVNTTSSTITATLPATPSAGQIITFVDYAGTWDTNILLINSNSNNVNGLASAGFRVSGTERGAINLVYIDSTQGWISYAGYTGTPSISIPLDVEYLVIAGGGGGGAGITGSFVGGGAGGGAGGFQTATLTSVALNTNFTVTVGAGGSAGVCGGGSSTSGSNSVFSNITSTGGGRGDNYDGSAAATGGSGGGGTGTGAAGTAGQGNAGGNGTGFILTAGYGGGGGASAIGGTGTTGAAGNGGAGTASSITGSSVTRGGGGGGGKSGSGTAGSGGAGGGGAGSISTATATAGSVNTGGGGGGGGNTNGGGCGGNGAAGGSGVVILKYADSFTISNPGGGLTLSTAAPSGGFKVTTVTAGTGNVSFA